MAFSGTNEDEQLPAQFKLLNLLKSLAHDEQLS